MRESRRYKLWIVLTLWCCFAGVGRSAAQTDVYVSALLVYANLPEGSPEAKEHGKRPQLKSYDLHSGLAPSKVDVAAVINGEPPEPVTVILEVIPVVGVTNWKLNEGNTDMQLLQSSKCDLAVFFRFERVQRIHGRTEVIFPDVSLDDIISYYKNRGFWPSDLIFKLTVQPVPGETSVANNVMRFTLPMNPPD